MMFKNKRLQLFLSFLLFSLAFVAGSAFAAEQPGCINCRFYQDLDDPDAILFREEWESRENLEHHIKSDTYRIILSLMELSEEPPEIKISTLSKTEGMEAIETLRS